MVFGFVVNMKTVLNLDIDFGLTQELQDKYLISRAFSSEYYYRDGLSFKSGLAHRSRLQGIEMIKGPNDKETINKAFTELRNKIDRCGGFVNYIITDIDVFGRVIVTIFDPVSGENLNNVLLSEKYSSVFRKYPQK